MFTDTFHVQADRVRCADKFRESSRGCQLRYWVSASAACLVFVLIALSANVIMSPAIAWGASEPDDSTPALESPPEDNGSGGGGSSAEASGRTTVTPGDARASTAPSRSAARPADTREQPPRGRGFGGQRTQASGPLVQTMRQTQSESPAFIAEPPPDPATSLNDLRTFLEDPNPAHAAAVLREHAARIGTPLEYSEGARPVRSTIDPFSVQIPDGPRLQLTPGIESNLQKRVNAVLEDPNTDAASACIVTFHAPPTIGDVIALFEAGARVLGPLGRSAVVLRAPAASIDSIASSAWVTAIAEYRPEYRYDPDRMTTNRPGVYIQPVRV